MNRLQNILDNLGKYKYLIVLGIIFLIVGVVDENSFWNRYRRCQDISRLKTEIHTYSEQYRNDTRKLKALGSHAEVERFAREKYHMKRDDEDVFIIQHVKDSDAVSAQANRK